MDLSISSGRPLPLGANLENGGVNFSVFSKNATRIFLDLYKTSEDTAPYASIELNEKDNRSGDIWHVFVSGLKAGALYQYRVDGPFEPSSGHRFNVNNPLIDPYAQAITNASFFKNLPKGYKTPVDKMDVELSSKWKWPKYPKAVVVDHNDFDWQGDKPLNRPMDETIIYETHLKGFTAGKENNVSCPGTYRGFIEKIDHLKRLGINAVEFLPIHEFDENENGRINPRTGTGLSNYWGYSTIGFFAPKASYASDKNPGGAVHEFKELVRELHKNGIEVILDVVYNHTAEGNEHGVSISFRGFDNSIYYQLVDTHKEYYMNYSGCGNTVNCSHPVVQDLIIDSLRSWVLNYHVDGFRFDLAPVLGRNTDGMIMSNPPLPVRIAQDPVLSKTKLIAEPWDAAGAYLVGKFPGGRWAEWNDRYRDDMRRFWRGDDHLASAAATRFTGSSDLYASSGRKPWHSINFITCHDGFTMNDLVSYNSKHNDENGEENRDGNDNNLSYNHGFEGATANPQIERIRNQVMRSMILSLMISEGTPMLLGGDEFRRGQQGNNNAYCQDNDISWFDWGIARMNDRLITFTSRAIALRKAHPVFRRKEYFGGFPSIIWHGVNGSNPDWNESSRFLAASLSGSEFKDENGKCDNDFYIAANSDRQDVIVTLPTLKNGLRWYRLADTSIDADDALTQNGKEEDLRAQSRYVVPSQSLVILIAK